MGYVIKKGATGAKDVKRWPHVKHDVSERKFDLNKVSQIQSLGIRIKRVRNKN